ncbi:MAG: neutral/alkaline non-lysosomal ceramidase N-terminal domain-containing protein [Planctomycetia bacterium]|nr:neutral/alkaline non-lysosomal ceramidase N-terminal domain-containing protein [Planctomycetia bacterium]
MKSPLSLSLILLCFILSTPWTASRGQESDAPTAANNSDLMIGFAAEEITPPIPYRMSGYFNERLSTGTLDPLWAKALILSQNKTKAAILICDIISIPDHVTTPIRENVSKAIGIPIENIVIAATHTHTGPLFEGKSREYLHQRAIERNGKDDAEIIDYQQFLIQKGTDALLKANETLRSASITTQKVQTENITFNRRFLMTDNTVVFNPGIKNPNIVHPAGPTDPEMQIVFFSDPETQKPFASLTNFALHLDTTGGTLNSGDYPYYIAEELKKEWGDQFFSLFGTGTCGDLNHIDVSGQKSQKAETIGKELAQLITDAHKNKNAEQENSNLAATEKRILWQRQQYSEAETEEAKKQMEIVVGEGNYPVTQRARYSAMVELAELPDFIYLQAQVIRLSDETAIVAIPGEVFVELGLAIKEQSPFKNTLIIELSQTSLCYIPTIKAFKEGSYETINSIIKPGGGEKIVEIAVEALNSLDMSPRN